MTQVGGASHLLWSIKLLRNQVVEAEGAFLLNAASLNPDVYHSNPLYISLAKGREYDQLPGCLQELAVRLKIFCDRLDESYKRTVISSFSANEQHLSRGD